MTRSVSPRLAPRELGRLRRLRAARGAAALALLACLAMSGIACSGMERQLRAPLDDYELYRKARVSQSLERRLAAAWQYLERHPKGEFAEELRRWFERVEPQFYYRAYNSRALLEDYLDALPDGPHAASAAQRIVELNLVEKYETSRDAAAIAAAARVRSELDEAREQREEFLQLMARWVRLVSAIDSFGQRTHELPHEFLYEYRMEEPRAECGRRRCDKLVYSEFLLPVDGELTRREASFEVVLELDAGAVVRAELVGDALFSRIGEASLLNVAKPGDAQARAENIGQTVHWIGNLLDATWPPAECARQPVAPVVFERRCDGRRLHLVAGPDGKADRVIIEAAATEAGTPQGP